MIHTDRILIAGPGLDNFSFPEDQALLIVGDTHGQNGALRNILERMGRMPTPGKRRTLVFLGDLIDRGPESLGCMKTAINDAKDLAGVDEVITLPGNHELLMADAIRGARKGPDHIGRRSAAETWAYNGGMAFMEEVYDAAGIAMPETAHRTILDFADLLAHQTGSDVVHRIDDQPSHFRMGDVLCVHAGVKPKKPLEFTLNMSHADHFDRDLRTCHWAWIRDEFLSWQGGWAENGKKDGDGVLVVHGHTVPVKCTARMGDGEDLRAAFDRINGNARICVDGGSARGTGVAGCIIAQGAARILFAHA